jgi:hypothetical protein
MHNESITPGPINLTRYAHQRQRPAAKPKATRKNARPSTTERSQVSQGKRFTLHATVATVLADVGAVIIADAFPSHLDALAWLAARHLEVPADTLDRVLDATAELHDAILAYHTPREGE